MSFLPLRSAEYLSTLYESTVKVEGPSRKVELPLELWEHLDESVRHQITEWATTYVRPRVDIVTEESE